MTSSDGHVTALPARGFGGGTSLFPLGVLLVLALVDEAARDAFGLLTPEIRDAFHLSNAGILLIEGAGGAAALVCTVPLALLADRTSRVHIVLVGAAFGGVFSLGLGLAWSPLVIAVTLAGLQMGQAVIFPTHNSLLADWYPIPARPRVYSAYRGGRALGAITGVLLAGGLAATLSWRAPFLVFAFISAALILAGTLLREPLRGRHDQIAQAGQLEPAVHHPPSLGEAWRMAWKIGVLRRLFFALPLLAPAIVGFSSLASLQYQQTFHLSVAERSFLSAAVQACSLIGLAAGAIMATRLAARGTRLVFRMLAISAVAGAGFAALFALAPSLPVAFAANVGIEACFSVIGPGLIFAVALAVPPRARSIGFSISALFVLPGLALLPVIGAVGDRAGLRYGLLLTVPVFLAGSLIVSSGASLVHGDLRNVRTAMRAPAVAAARRRDGRLPLLTVLDLTAGYGGGPVLTGINLEVTHGEIVALLGANGAGKSTLMRAIGGVVEADGGAVIFDGRDITHMPPDAIARLGIAQLPGGEGVFPTLTVEDNLRAAAWQTRRHSPTYQDQLREALSLFPGLAARPALRAGSLSGGEQQMLALAMAFLSRPRLLLIDELSLGLAPVVVERLLASVRTLRDRGTTVMLVEQSLNIAMSVADRAYLLDDGAVRSSGTAQEISARPELLRSVYLREAVTRLPVPASRARPGPHRPPILDLSRVCVSFGGIRALDDISLAARRGEVVGIIGPNGAGKTTLLDVVSGFVRPAAGRVALHGSDVTNRAPATRARLGLGRSFQSSRLFGGMSVRETLAVALEKFIGVTDPLNAALRLPAQQVTEAAIAERTSEILALLGLERFSDTLVSELSTGTRHLVDLAAVVASRPDVVLLDEPSSGVAQREVESMAGPLRSVRDQLDATLLIVEHDITFVCEVADRLIVLDRGRLIAGGDPAEVLRAPEVGAAFLGTGGPAPSRSGSPGN